MKAIGFEVAADGFGAEAVLEICHIDFEGLRCRGKKDIGDESRLLVNAVNDPQTGVREDGLERACDDFELVCFQAVNGDPLDEDTVIGEVVADLLIKFPGIEDPTVAGFGMRGIGDNDRPFALRGHYVIAAIVNDDVCLRVLEEIVIFLREQRGSFDDALFEVNNSERFDIG